MLASPDLECMQLPPVCFCNVPDGELCGQCHIASSALWSTALKLTLPASVRHAKDPAFAAFLDIVRHRPPTQQEIDAVFRPAAYITEEQVHEHADFDTTILCSHNDSAREHNNKMIWAAFHAGRVQQVFMTPLQHNIPQDVAIVPDIAKWMMDSGFHTLQQVAVGARVIFTPNFDLDKGAANGATGIVHDLQLDDARQHVVAITVRMDIGGALVRVRRSDSEPRFYDGDRYYKSTFPLALAWAITGHRCQVGRQLQLLLMHGLVCGMGPMCPVTLYRPALYWLPASYHRVRLLARRA